MQGGKPARAAALAMARLQRRHIPWALLRLMRGPGGLGRPEGLSFAKVLGSGRGGGFGAVPGLDHQGVFAAFQTPEQAKAFIDRSPAIQAYKERAVEWFTAILVPTGSRGTWSGHELQGDGSTSCQGPLVVLTRASIRPSRAAAFWRHSPPSERDLATAEGCRLAVGLGEAPWLRQATISWWDSLEAMTAYAHSGAHKVAIDAAWQEQYFSEWMFARFVPTDVHGSWQGQHLSLEPVHV